MMPIADFIRNASAEEKEKVYMRVMTAVGKRQAATLKPPRYSSVCTVDPAEAKQRRFYSEPLPGTVGN